MRLIVTLFILFTTQINAQNLTGIWKGNFEQNNLDYGNSKYTSETYKYEVQINNLTTNGLEGVTYSYLNTRFYGKAALKGIYKPSAKTITLKETIMLDLRASGRTEPCLMTCYLDYKKIGKLEILSGTYSSVNAKTKTDCGSGTVYLEKTEETDFEKEPFLMKKKAEPKSEKAKPKIESKKTEKKPIVKTPPKVVIPEKKKTLEPKKEIAKTTPKKNIETKKVETKKVEIKKSTAETIVKNQPKKVKNGAEDFIVKKDKNLSKPKDTAVDTKKENPIVLEKPKEDPKKEEPKVKVIPEPEATELIERKNKLVNTIYVDNKEVYLAFYDNGLIDNDTISVYKDNQLVIDKKRLSTNPLVLTLKFDDVNTYYEIIAVAENLGDEPPNTALMVINYGNKRREVSLSSDMNTNAKLIIKYQP